MNVIKIMFELVIKFGLYEVVKRGFVNFEGYGDIKMFIGWFKFIVGGLVGMIV